MKSLGVEPPEQLSAEEKAKSQAKLAQTKKEADHKIDEMSDEELLNHNEDNMRLERKQKEDFDNKFDQLSEDDKLAGVSDVLGVDLLQITSSIKRQLNQNINKRKLRNHNLIQLSAEHISDQDAELESEKQPAKAEAVALGDDTVADDEDLSFTSLAKKARSQVDLKRTIDDTAEAKARAEKRAAELSTDSQPKEETNAKEEDASAEPKKQLSQTEATADSTKQDAPKKGEKTEDAKTDAAPTPTPSAATDEVKVVTPAPAAAPKSTKPAVTAIPVSSTGNAVLVTGATHARELLSAQVPLFLCLKLLHQGVAQSREKYQKLLAADKFLFIPVINVDGAALVEEHWLSDHKILNKRKNGNQANAQCGAEDSGVDLNRNYGVDWESENAKNRTELCGDYWPGESAFSEPESRALRDYVGQHKSEIKFIINCHTSGNDFIWPFNGREHNDIEARAPGTLAVF